MLFDIDLIVPAGTRQLAPVMSKAHLIAGTLTQVRIFFPPGPATLVHVVLKDRLFQLVPVNPEGDINLDDNYVIADMEYPLTDAPYELDMIGWSPNAVYDHVITYEFQLKPLPGQSFESFNNQLLALVGQRPKGQ